MRLLSVFVLLVFLTGCDMIRDQLDGNQPPVIETFEIEPAEGESSLLAELLWVVADVENDTVSCTLDFGDGQNQQIENCAQINSTFHTYTEAGGFTAILSATDETSTVHKSAGVRITVEDDGQP